ncbi:MAG: metallophosphoesterase family protein [Nanoarchaeota archaeon]
MRYGVFGDVQGVYDNLKQMFMYYNKSGIDSFLCLGDIIQNGDKYSDNLCIDSIRKRNCYVVRGDHDDISNIVAEYGKIYQENIAFLDKLPLVLRLGNILLFHKSLSGQEKIEDVKDASKEFEEIEMKYPNIVKIAFYGHTHKIKGFIKKENNIYDINLKPKDKIILQENNIYLINPGSIGLPDKGNPSFGIFDADKNTFEIKCL